MLKELKKKKHLHFSILSPAMLFLVIYEKLMAKFDVNLTQLSHLTDKETNYLIVHTAV